MTAASLDNYGTSSLAGNGTNFAALDVSGATTNNGSISIYSDTEELAGAVGGAGSFSLSTPIFSSTRAFRPGRPSTRAARTRSRSSRRRSSPARSAVSGPATRSTRRTFSCPATTFNFVENSGGTGGTLTLHDGSLTANILMTGVYTKSDFTLAPDSGTGTLVKFV